MQRGLLQEAPVIQQAPRQEERIQKMHKQKAAENCREGDQLSVGACWNQSLSALGTAKQQQIDGLGAKTMPKTQPDFRPANPWDKARIEGSMLDSGDSTFQVRAEEC